MNNAAMTGAKRAPSLELVLGTRFFQRSDSEAELLVRFHGLSSKDPRVAHFHGPPL